MCYLVIMVPKRETYYERIKYLQNKCVQYWPNINDKLQAGDITVRHVGEKTYAEHTVRHFKIYHNTVRLYPL